jgi:hypothetical protein
MEPGSIIGLPLDMNVFITADLDTSREPHYTISELAKFFLNRSPGWVRWRERKGYFILDAEYDDEKKEFVAGDKSTPYGLMRTPEGARFYTLTDVEGIAHSLEQKSAISLTQMYLAIEVVRVQARIFGYIP